MTPIIKHIYVTNKKTRLSVIISTRTAIAGKEIAGEETLDCSMPHFIYRLLKGYLQDPDKIINKTPGLKDDIQGYPQDYLKLILRGIIG